MNLDVIVRIDSSEASMRAAEWAAHEAAIRGAQLRVVSVPVLPPPRAWNSMPPGRPDDVADAITQAARQAASAAAARAARAAPALHITAQVRSGVPGQVLSELAAGPGRPRRPWPERNGA